MVSGPAARAVKDHQPRLEDRARARASARWAKAAADRSTGTVPPEAAEVQAAGRLLQTDGQTGGQLDGLELAEPGDDGGQQGAHGDDEDADRPALLGVGQAAQDGQALGDGVGARREALVGKGLPGGHAGDVVGRQVAAQGQGGLLGLAAGGGDDQQRRAGGLGGAGRRRVAAGDPLDALLS